MTALGSFRLDGRVAAVSGTTRGLGRAIAVALAAAGADIVHLNRHPGRGPDSEIAAAGRRVADVHLDLAGLDDTDAGRCLNAAAAAFGRLDILVNNAGVIERSPATEVSEDGLLRVLDADLTAPALLARAAGRRFMAAGGGKIVNVASVLSLRGGDGVLGYTMAKHAVAGLTRALAVEWARHGVNVNAVVPGYVATDLTAALRADPDRRRSILSRIPAGRWGTPDDLGGAVVFLAAPASDYVHGHLLAVDGGWLAG